MSTAILSDEDEYLRLTRELEGRDIDVKETERSTAEASARTTAMQVERESIVVATQGGRKDMYLQ